MTAAVSSDRSNRLGTDQVEPWAGNAVRAAPEGRAAGARYHSKS